MKHRVLTWPSLLLFLACTLLGCSESTGSLGVYPQKDAVSTSSATYGVLSSDMLNNKVRANSSDCYLGKIIDPETGKAVVASFATQFHTFENYKFPSQSLMLTNASTGLYCDSVEIRLFISATFGDTSNPMKLSVYPLSKTKLMKESDTFYTDDDLMEKFVDEGQEPIATKVFTATDYAVSEEFRESDSYSDNVRIVLPAKVGDDIIKAYYTDPTYFRDSYNFIRNVCPGFYVCTTNGCGTMIELDVETMNLYFRYKYAADSDSIVEALSRFAATPEVIQSTHFENADLSSLIGHADYTMLKAPAGICTELALPIDEIYSGHETDSISRASISLTRINSEEEDEDNALDVPDMLLLVRKQNMTSFFENQQVADGQQAYTTSFNTTYNVYTFSNLSRLVSYCHKEKLAGMKAEGKSEAEWEASHPDWDKVVLVPVTVTTTTDSYGTETQVSVNQQMSLCSTKLVRGTAASPIPMQIIYSRFTDQ